MKHQHLEKAENWFLGLLGAHLGLTVAVGINAISMVGTLQDIRSGDQGIDAALVERIELWGNISLIGYLVLFGVGWHLVRWLDTCYWYAKSAIGASGFKHENWTMGAWLIPVFNLVKPYLIISEIYRAGGSTYTREHEWKKEKASDRLLAWWIFWVVAHVLMAISQSHLQKLSLRSDFTASYLLSLYSGEALLCAISLVLTILWCIVARVLTQRLLDRSHCPIIVDQPVTEPDPAFTPETTAESSLNAPTGQDDALAELEKHASSGESAVAPAATRVDEDAIYAEIATELERGTENKGLWTRLFVECDGDERQTKLLYIRHRAAKMIADEQQRLEQDRHACIAHHEV